MELIEILKSIILGIIEGITEWLPISSTGHMILVDQFLQLNMSGAFKEMYFVVIQLGAIMAVVALYWERIFPFDFKSKEIVKKDIFIMWVKIFIACVPAAIVGILWDDKINELFYNFKSVAIVLIVFGVLFIVIENYNKGKNPKVDNINNLSFKIAIIIGVFQLIAAVFPGTSRSGATIVGALLLGVSRGVAAEFTFFLAIPVMLGASLLKLIKFGVVFTSLEGAVLIVGIIISFIVSLFVIKFLMDYIKKHGFKVFGWYRIVLGCILLLNVLLIKS
ncbi:MAG: undecaprenyl-diphosphate phosphatase [Terrisporobacter othiniensis]|uniref:undecaprenyl-diphosphate phosphatase n=1 Tax=Terrisporobacter petrolearius TaxID=1460447 RepID=UPI0022E0A157|nr:undecaprenyl-diphosphate phosphatase [Terrisporobacter petrolearius]MDU4859847.1 undecaprenyl-diphosphate phosphatase [Terrisporobacter othiniensis]MDU6993984.1 undecaprenyl-diphosphate phosphatase [Terrisporobacter othiniensis]